MSEWLVAFLFSYRNICAFQEGCCLLPLSGGWACWRTELLITPSMGTHFRVLPFLLCKVGPIILLSACSCLPDGDSPGLTSPPQPVGPTESWRHFWNSTNVTGGGPSLCLKTCNEIMSVCYTCGLTLCNPACSCSAWGCCLCAQHPAITSNWAQLWLCWRQAKGLTSKRKGMPAGLALLPAGVFPVLAQHR